MYTPEGKSKVYLLIVFIVASLIGWGIFNFYRPIIIEASCSEISANIFSSISRYSIGEENSYETIKQKCVRNSIGN